MKSSTSILALRYTPVSVVGGVRKAVGGFLRYIQHRDQQVERDSRTAVDAYVRYVAHRDRTSPRGRVFGRDGDLTGADRRRFVDFVGRSIEGLQPKWAAGRDGKRVDRQRAVYTLILSPEDWRGLDLRRLARAAMHQLENDSGAIGIGPWFAAEHRNTKHHHVHIVLAARREVDRGKYSTLLITRRRLQGMKDAIALEIRGQRALDREAPRAAPALASQPGTPCPRTDSRPGHIGATRWYWRAKPRSKKVPRHKHVRPVLRPMAITGTVLHLQAVARHYGDRMAYELELEADRADRLGWLR